MTALTDADRRSLEDALTETWDRVLAELPKSEQAMTDADIVTALVPAINALLTRHLNAAAAAIEAERTRHWQQHLTEHPYADATSCPKDYGKHDAYYAAARIVRSLAP